MKMNEKIKIKQGVTEINLTSLVDVCLTLVIIFMVSYPLVMQSGIKVSTPSLKKAQSVMDETELKAEITLKNDNEIILNGQTIESALLADSLKSIMDASRDKLVLISADENVLHDKVVAVLDIAKQSGAQQLSIVKQKQTPGGSHGRPN